MGFPQAPLSAADLDHFIANGFVRLDDAFPASLAAAGRAILWRDLGLDPERPDTWTKPVIRLGHYSGPAFREAANTPRLHAAYDQLAGPGRWLLPQGLGTFPVRFPSPEDPGDGGWHIDVSFLPPGGDPRDFRAYRANWRSEGRALLMLFLFSDVGRDDAPTRIRIGSHLDMARRLLPMGEQGVDVFEHDFGATAHLPEALATGPAGTVYLCHPFLVHAAQPHRGTMPKFMAQPPLLPRGPVYREGERGAASPVEAAIRMALSGQSL